MTVLLSVGLLLADFLNPATSSDSFAAEPTQPSHPPSTRQTPRPVAEDEKRAQRRMAAITFRRMEDRYRRIHAAIEEWGFVSTSVPLVVDSRWLIQNSSRQELEELAQFWAVQASTGTPSNLYELITTVAINPGWRTRAKHDLMIELKLSYDSGAMQILECMVPENTGVEISPSPFQLVRPWEYTVAFKHQDEIALALAMSLQKAGFASQGSTFRQWLGFRRPLVAVKSSTSTRMPEGTDHLVIHATAREKKDTPEVGVETQSVPIRILIGVFRNAPTDSFGDLFMDTSSEWIEKDSKAETAAFRLAKNAIARDRAIAEEYKRSFDDADLVRQVSTEIPHYYDEHFRVSLPKVQVP